MKTPLEITDKRVQKIRAAWEHESPGIVLTDDFVRKQLEFVRDLTDYENVQNDTDRDVWAILKRLYSQFLDRPITGIVIQVEIGPREFVSLRRFIEDFPRATWSEEERE